MLQTCQFFELVDFRQTVQVVGDQALGDGSEESQCGDAGARAEFGDVPAAARVAVERGEMQVDVARGCACLRRRRPDRGGPGS